MIFINKFVKCEIGIDYFINELVKFEIGVDYFFKNIFTSNILESVPYI